MRFNELDFIIEQVRKGQDLLLAYVIRNGKKYALVDKDYFGEINAEANSGIGELIIVGEKELVLVPEDIFHNMVNKAPVRMGREIKIGDPFKVSNDVLTQWVGSILLTYDHNLGECKIQVGDDVDQGSDNSSSFYTVNRFNNPEKIELLIKFFDKVKSLRKQGSL